MLSARPGSWNEQLTQVMARRQIDRLGQIVFIGLAAFLARLD
jgi:hypothetical protein